MLFVLAYKLWFAVVAHMFLTYVIVGTIIARSSVENPFYAPDQDLHSDGFGLFEIADMAARSIDAQFSHFYSRMLRRMNVDGSVDNTTRSVYNQTEW
jgi:hypothetical protein